jgi:hypothetical protein
MACENSIASVKEMLTRLNSHSFHPFLLVAPRRMLVGLPQLWWMSQEFFSATIIISPWFSKLLYHLRDKQQACWAEVQRRSLTPIDMINQSINNWASASLIKSFCCWCHVQYINWQLNNTVLEKLCFWTLSTI